MRHFLVVSDVMTKDVVTVAEDTPFKAVAAVLAEHHISAAPVRGTDGWIAGVVSETSLNILAISLSNPRRISSVSASDCSEIPWAERHPSAAAICSSVSFTSTQWRLSALWPVCEKSLRLSLLERPAGIA